MTIMHIHINNNYQRLNVFTRCKASKQLEDPTLTAAAAAAVAEAEAEEQALAAALEAITRLPSKSGRGPRRSLCVEVDSYSLLNILIR